MIENKWVFRKAEFDDIYKIRKKVFIDELGLSEDVHFDAYDERSLHVLISEGGTYLATGRLYEDDGKFYIGGIAVLKEVRGKKVGDFVVRLLLSKAFELLADEVYVYARQESVMFYETLGFVGCGQTHEMEPGDIRIVMKVTAENSPLNHNCGDCASCGGCS